MYLCLVLLIQMLLILIEFHVTNRNVPKQYQRDFLVESCESELKMRKLKDAVVKSGCETYLNYPCLWGGVVAGQPVVAGLHDFGMRALNNIWNAIVKLCPDDVSVGTHVTQL